MSESDLLLDTSVWWEIFRGSETGRRLQLEFLESGRLTIHTSAITPGEISAKLGSLGFESRAGECLSAIRRASRIHDVTAELAVRGGVLRKELRNSDPDASLADGIILATADAIRSRLLSSDAAFRDRPELVDFKWSP